MARKAYTPSEPVFVDKRLYKRNEVFVTEKPKGSKWEPVTKAEKAAIEASQPLAGDPPLEGLSKAALEALAVDRKVDPTGLTKRQLIDAIKAADEPKL